jgi:hypothetical protein
MSSGQHRTDVKDVELSAAKLRADRCNRIGIIRRKSLILAN